METKIKKGFAILVLTILVAIYVIGLPMVFIIIDFIHPESKCNFSLITLFAANLKLIVNNLSGLIIGTWLFLNVDKLKQDKWTWTLIGLVYGQYSLILLAIVLFVQNIGSRIDLFRSLSKILILLIITFFLNIASEPLLTPYFTYILDVEHYGLIMEYSTYLTFVTYGIVILMNILFAIKLSAWIKNLNISKKAIWIIATLILGLFPVILFNILTIIRKENN